MFRLPKIRTCFCGSGLNRYELRDASGLFLTFVCYECEDRRKKEFNPRILNEAYDPDKSDVEYNDEY